MCVALYIQTHIIPLLKLKIIKKNVIKPKYTTNNEVSHY